MTYKTPFRFFPRASACAGLALGLLLGGCSNNNQSGADMAVADLTVPIDQTRPPPNPDALTTAFDSQFIGFWGVKAKVETIQKLPFFGDTHSTTTILSVAEFRHDGMNNLVMDQSECHVTSKSANPAITTDVPDKIADTTPKLSGIVHVYGTDGDLGFRRDQVATGIGCHLVDPFNDALPTDPKDPRVFDQDGDGQVGVTINPQTPVQGSVYVAQRRKYSYDNAISASPTRYTGSIIDRSEQYILDASDNNLKSQVQSTPVDAMSVFEIVKLSTQYDCTRLKSEAGTLFTLQ